MNKHPFSLTALGILPNQLRKVWTPEFGDPEVVLNDLRWTSFWGGYQVWKARMLLVRTYWKNKNTKRSSKTFNSSTCKNPFHFLTKRVDLSKQKLTRCACSRVKRQLPKEKKLDISQFFEKSEEILSENKDVVNFGNENCNTDYLDMKHLPKMSSPNTRNYTRNYTSQDDMIRGEHDRGRKRLVQLALTSFLRTK